MRGYFVITSRLITESRSGTRPGVGLISVGWMGKLHTKAYQAVPLTYPELGVAPRLVVAADTEPSRAQYAVDVLGYAAGTTDYREVLANPEVDVVSICAPTSCTPRWGWLPPRRASTSGSRSPSGAARRGAGRGAGGEAAGVVTSVGFNYRHAPAVEHIRELVASGRLGRITNVRCVFFAGYSGRSARCAVLAVPACVRRQRRPRRPGQPRRRPVHLPGRSGVRRDRADLHRALPPAHPGRWARAPTSP